VGESLDLARRLFELFMSGDVERMLPLVDPDIEVRPRGMPHEVYRGHDGLRRLLADSQASGREATVSVEQYVASGDRVAVLGRIRVRQQQSLADSSAAWMLETRLGLVTRGVSYRSHASALRAVGAGGAVHA
jgi:ketosteroid isomerase-like protein